MDWRLRARHRARNACALPERNLLSGLLKTANMEYQDTLNLPLTDFAMAADLATREPLSSTLTPMKTNPARQSNAFAPGPARLAHSLSSDVVALMRRGWTLAILALLFLAARLAAADSSQWKFFVFSVAADGTATIWDNLGLRGALELPSKADGHPVIRLGGGAFAFDAGVTSVVIPSPVNTIETSAFYHCVNLKTITLPISLRTIEPGAFDYCISLRSINVNSANPYFTTVGGALFNKDQTTLMQFPGGSANSYVVPDGVTRIEGYAFGSLYSLTNLVIPASVREIGSSAFYGCAGLTSITLPEGITIIPTNLFQNCSKLTSITIPDSVREIQLRAFQGCTSLTNVTLGRNLRIIDNNAFEGCTSLTSITIPESVIAIGDNAFAGCTSLTSMTILDGVPTIEGQNAGWLDQVVYTPARGVRLLSVASSNPSNGVSITVSPEDTSSLTNGTTPFTRTYKSNSVVTLTAPDSAGAYPFQRWQKDGSNWVTTLSTTVTMDDAHALTAVYGAGELTLADAVDMPGWSWVTDGKPEGWFAETNVTHDGTDAARSGIIGHSQITWLETTMSGAGMLTFWWKVSSETNRDYLSFAVDGVEQERISGEEGWVQVTNTLAKSGGHTLRWTYATDGTTIGNNAFAGCTSLTNMTIGNGVISIGDSAFSGCSRLADIRIGRGVRFIGAQVFSGCSSLRAITADAFNPAFSSVDGVLFNQRRTVLVQYPTARWGKYTIPDGVETIGTYAFSSAYGLTGVTFPDSVTNIESYAFYRCTQIANITLPASLLSIGRSAFNYCSLLTGAYFEGNAPTPGEYAFGHDPKSTLYFQDGTTGWKTKFGGRPTKRWYPEISTSLQVIMLGQGTLSPNYSDAMLQLGTTNSMTAAGANGFAFEKWILSTNWGDGVTFTNAKLTFVMQSNLTLQVIFVDVARPSVSIAYPVAKQQISNAMATVWGSASDNARVAQVLCRINTSDWVIADGTTNWTANLPLTLGTNRVQVFAVDTAGNFSKTNSVNFTRVDSYAGLFMPQATEAISATNAGSVAISLTDSSTFSGRLILAGKTLSFGGAFDTNGHAAVTVRRTGSTPLSLNLGLDSQTVTGQVSTTGWTADLLALRQAMTSSNAFAGPYSMLIMGDHGATNAPPGDGPLTVGVSGSSSVTVSGTMADGSAVTLGTGHSAEGTWPFYASIYSGRGLVIGWMSFATNAGSHELVWVKPPDSKTQYYPIGFREERPVALQRYLQPAPEESALGWTNGLLFLGGGNLPTSLAADVVVTNNTIKSVGGTVSNLSLTITASSGLFSGSFVHPATHKKVTIRGGVMQGLPWLAPANQVGVGGGWFLGTNQAGHVWLEPKP